MRKLLPLSNILGYLGGMIGGMIAKGPPKPKRPPPMPQRRTWRSVGRRRRLAAGLLGLALLGAAGLATSSATAQAQGSQPEGRFGDAACWDQIASPPFADIGDLPAESVVAVKCLVHYGVTKGVTPVAFGPEAVVTRAQMARFLIRTLSALEVSLPDASPSPFADVRDLNADTRRAISRLSQTGITRGTTATTFGPGEQVTRSQMALFLTRLLRKAGVSLPAPADTPFSDVDGLSESRTGAISQVSALGIIEGAARDAFEPHGLVNREDIALFLSRVLQAGKARPVRLEMRLTSITAPTAGSVGGTVVATKPNGEPYPGLFVDVFVTRSRRVAGGCDVDANARVNGDDGGTSVDCQIDRGDPRTDSAGEVRFGLTHSTQPEVDRVVAWVGNIGEVFDDRQVRAKAHDLVTWLASPEAIFVSAPDNALYGKTVQVTARLFGPNSYGQTVILEAIANGVTRIQMEKIVGYSGSVAFWLPGRVDPTRDNDPDVEETIKVFWDRNGNGVHDGPAELSAEETLQWYDI